MGMRVSAVEVVWVAVVMLGGGEAKGFNIWPMPKWVSNGHRTMFMSPDFELILLNRHPDSSSILRQGFSRMLDVVTLGRDLQTNFSSPLLLKGIRLLVPSSHHPLQYGIDESYNLSIPSPGNPNYGLLQAKTVYGALHGLQTFSQLCHFNFTTKVIEVSMTPWAIIDQPRFPYRGLLIDTSRHYQPLPMIKKVIDAMAYSKLNVLHWHISDTQSFPLEIPSFPKLWDGAYSVSERYTFADVADIVSYAQMQGINVLAEIDVPGHARSWGVGYPSLWPSKDCQQPLDVSNEFTFKVIDGILSDFSKVFKFKFVHLGGDEVNTITRTIADELLKLLGAAGQSKLDQEVAGHQHLTYRNGKNLWLKKHDMNESQAYQYFVLRAQKIALSHGYEIINWEETFNNFGDKLSRRTVVHNWLDISVPQHAVASGLRCIVSNQDKWYLDHLTTTWKEFYMNEPLTNITNGKQKGLVIGGEVCMWGETVDVSDIEQTIWPRAAAAAERLWTPYNKVAKDPEQVTGRLAHFRCLLNQRGVAAAPLAGLGRGAPIEPGSCYKQ